MWSLLCVLLISAVSRAVPVENRGESEFCSGNQIAAARAINHVGARITQEIRGSDNSFFSPVGLSMALGMAQLGARGRTADQMEESLGYKKHGVTGRQIHEGIQELTQKYLRSENDEYDLNIANGFFSQVGLEVPESYRQGLKAYYDGESQSLDFAKNAAEATRSINDWASEKTRGKVENFFAEPLPQDTQVVLTNAIYFKGTWKVQFPKDNTVEAPFYIGDGTVTKAHMMSLSKEKLPYFVDKESGYKYLELAYKGDEVSMILALPHNSAEPLNLAMTPELLCRITSNLRKVEVRKVLIPKFKLEYEASLKEALQEMGMTDAFTSAADFSGLQDGVLISDVLQKAVIEVNEEGSEAAAITGVVVTLYSSIGPDFIANRPFAFHIVHKKAGLVLFSGKVQSI